MFRTEPAGKGFQMTFGMHHRRLGAQKNSWYLRTGEVHHFLCRCGCVEQTYSLVSKIHHPNHTCSVCGNTRYLDSTMFLGDPKVIRWSAFFWDINETKSNMAWSVSAYAHIPVFDYAIQKIRLKKFIFAVATLTFKGEHDYEELAPNLLRKYVYNGNVNARTLKEMMQEALNERLSSYVLTDPIEAIVWMKAQEVPESGSMSRINLYRFFLRNPHLKEYDFYYWKNFETFREISKQNPTVKEMLAFIMNFRQERSLKKACYTAYERAMIQLSYYNPVADFNFTRLIDDRNFLLRLILIDTKVKMKLFDETRWGEVKTLVDFLSEHYTQKQITEFFCDMKPSNYFKDTVQMFRGEMADFIKEHFNKVPLRIERLHSEFIRVGRMWKYVHGEKKRFDYHKNDLAAQGVIDGLTFQLPETTEVLHEWATLLHNCMFGYSDMVHKGKTVIYGVFKGKKLLYAVEIRHNKIVQALGKFNRQIKEEDRKRIDMWFMKSYMASWLHYAAE